MNSDSDFRDLLRKTLVAVLLCAAVVCVCYWFVDRPVALFVHGRKLSDYAVLKWLTYPPPIVQAWAPFLLAVLMVRRAVGGAFRRWEWAVIGACVSIVVADQFRDSASFLFGRYWPETWVDDNPSLIRDGAYGFHPFHRGEAYDSFPSGHMTRTLAVVSVFWIAYPKCRWACVVAALAVAIGLIGMDYHFVSDVIAGSVLGGVVGAYVSQFCGLRGTGAGSR